MRCGTAGETGATAVLASLGAGPIGKARKSGIAGLQLTASQPLPPSGWGPSTCGVFSKLRASHTQHIALDVNTNHSHYTPGRTFTLHRTAASAVAATRHRTARPTPASHRQPASHQTRSIVMTSPRPFEHLAAPKRRRSTARPVTLAMALVAGLATAGAPAQTAADAAAPASAPPATPNVSPNTNPSTPDRDPATPTAVLPEVRVRAGAQAETATSPVPGYAARRSATGTRTDTPLNEVPQSISVISAEQVRDQASHNMQEALRYTAGVRTETYGVDNRGDWFTLRGASEGSTLLDGLRLPLSGYWGILRNEPYAFERIEVLRGPSSVMAGQNGPGGVVNLVSKRPQAQTQGEAGLQLGNYRHKQLHADLTGPLNTDRTWLYRVVALAKDSDTQVTHAFDEREFLAPSVTWQPNAATSLTLFGEYQRDESGNLNAFFPAQGTLLPAPNGPLPFDTFIGEPDWDTYGGTRYRAGWHFRQQLTDNWTLRQNLRHDRVDGLMRTMYARWFDGYVDANGAPDPDGRYLNREYSVFDDKDRITSADLLLEGKLKLGGTQHTLLFGLDALRSRNEQKSWGGTATPLDVYNPVYGSFPLPALADVAPTANRVARTGVLVQDQIKMGERWVLVAGLRRDRARTEVVGGATKKDAATSKNLGLVWLGDGGWSPYLSYAESFEPVSGVNASGALFEPRRGKQVEAGVKWQPANQRLMATAALYRMKEKNRLATDPDNVNFSIQRGEITAQGLELEAAANLRAWDLVANYTYSDVKLTSTTPDDVRYLDQQLGNIPRHSAAVWAVHNLGVWGLPGLKAGLGVRRVGKTWDGTGGLPVPATTLFDALVAYDLDAWRLALNVNNLSDKTYVASCLERGDCWYGNKRRAVLSATYRW
jgi:iron complex outermembrane receptor protein